MSKIHQFVRTATLDAANQASPLDAFVVLLKRGLGGCLGTVGMMEPVILQRVLAACSTQVDMVRREECADLPGDAVTVSVLVGLLANTTVRTVGEVPIAGIRDGAIADLVLIGKALTLCEAGLVGYYLHDRSNTLKTVGLTKKFSFTEEMCHSEAWDLNTMEITPS